MMFTRGNRADYDFWARQGNYGWSYEEVLPFFKKSEDQLDPFLAKDTKFHSRGESYNFKGCPGFIAYCFLHRWPSTGGEGKLCDAIGSCL